MNSTMRLMFSETGVVSRSRNCGRATLTCVTVLLTLKNCRPCCANCWLNFVAMGSGKYFWCSHSCRMSRCKPLLRKLRLGRPATVSVSTGLMMESLCVARKCFSTSSSVASLSGSGTLRQMYSRLEALLLDPFFDDGLVLHDFHARLEHVERHPRKFFRVQLAQLVLVIVIIRRAENDAAQAALRDERVNALRRLRRRALGLVKRGEMIFENVRDGFVLARPRRIVQRADKKLRCRAVGFFLA